MKSLNKLYCNETDIVNDNKWKLIRIILPALKCPRLLLLYECLGIQISKTMIGLTAQPTSQRVRRYKFAICLRCHIKSLIYSNGCREDHNNSAVQQQTNRFRKIGTMNDRLPHFSTRPTTSPNEKCKHLRYLIAQILREYI